MKKVMNLVKKATKWYINKVEETYAMTPTGMLIIRK